MINCPSPQIAPHGLPWPYIWNTNWNPEKSLPAETKPCQAWPPGKQRLPASAVLQPADMISIPAHSLPPLSLFYAPLFLTKCMNIRNSGSLCQTVAIPSTAYTKWKLSKLTLKTTSGSICTGGNHKLIYACKISEIFLTKDIGSEGSQNVIIMNWSILSHTALNDFMTLYNLPVQNISNRDGNLSRQSYTLVDFGIKHY